MADINGTLDQGQTDMSGMRQQQWLAQNGFEGTAEVISISDTGTFFNMDPVFILTVKIQPAMIAVAFQTTGKINISRVAIPMVGDNIKIKYNPTNPTQFVVL